MHASALDGPVAQRGEDGKGLGEVVDADDADGCVEGSDGGGDRGVRVEVLEERGGEDGVGG